jgi:DTW domain-containing protein YfiP
MWTMRRKPMIAPRCPDCRLHRESCLCAELPTVWTRTRVALVLHQSEEYKSSNTGRLAVRCLPNSVVIAHGRPPQNAVPDRPVVIEAPYPWQDSRGPCVLLFPGEDARPIEEWRDREGLTVIALDGTWSQAARARRRLPGLLDLPSAFVPSQPPLYALRYDPRPGRVGTMEAIARALGVLEGQGVQASLERILGVAAERTWRARGRGQPETPCRL